MLFCFSRRSEGVQGAFRSPPACIAAHQLRRRGILAGGLTRRLRRGSAGASYEMLFCFGRRSEGVQGTSGKPPACIAARQLRRRGILAGGLTRRLRRGWWAAAPRGAVLSFEAKESTKESTRHGDSRGGPRRYAPWASVCGSPSGCPRPRLAALTRREKALDCPFLKEGVRNVARSIVE